jgi:DNA-directed RNA polymerase sigma subunit (sigma70/sigma32)
MRIGTHDDNMDDMKQRQRHGLPHHVVTAIRTLLAQGKTQQEVADLYGVSRSRIRDIGLRDTYRHLPDPDILA